MEELMDRSGETPAAAGKKPQQRRRRWRPDEHTRFLEALQMFGRDWTRIEEHVGTRTTKQLRSHAQKYFENARKLGVTGLPPPRSKRRRKHAVPQQPQSSTAAGLLPPDMQSFDWASISGTSASAWVNHEGVESQTEQVAATYPGRDDNSFMGTASFFSAMTMDMNWTGTSSTSEAPPLSLPDYKTMLAMEMEWAGTSSTSEAPPLSLPDYKTMLAMEMEWDGTSSTSEAPPLPLPDYKTMLAGDEVELEPWDIIMQEIKDMGLELDLDMSIFPSIIHAPGGSEYGAPPPHHGVPAVPDQPETSVNIDGGCSSDAKIDG